MSHHMRSLTITFTSAPAAPPAAVLPTHLGLVELCLSLFFCLSAHGLLILLQGHIGV